MNDTTWLINLGEKIIMPSVHQALYIRWVMPGAERKKMRGIKRGGIPWAVKQELKEMLVKLSHCWLPFYVTLDPDCKMVTQVICGVFAAPENDVVHVNIVDNELKVKFLLGPEDVDRIEQIICGLGLGDQLEILKKSMAYIDKEEL